MKLTLIMTLCLISSIESQTNDPTAILLSAINSASMQLQALGTLTLNNNTFTQLIQVLNGVFGSMQVTTVPFYQTQISQLNSNAVTIMNSIQSVNASASANTMMIFNLVNSIGMSFTNQVWNMGNTLNNFQNAVVPQVATLTSNLKSLKSTIEELNTSGAAVMSGYQNLSTDLAKTNQLAIPFHSIMTSLSQLVFFKVQFKLTDLSLSSTALPFCKSFIYTYQQSFQFTPFLEIRIIFTGEPNANGPNAYDVVIDLATNTAVGILICDRSQSTFTLHPANLHIRATPESRSA